MNDLSPRPSAPPTTEFLDSLYAPAEKGSPRRDAALIQDVPKTIEEIPDWILALSLQTTMSLLDVVSNLPKGFHYQMKRLKLLEEFFGRRPEILNGSALSVCREILRQNSEVVKQLKGWAFMHKVDDEPPQNVKAAASAPQHEPPTTNGKPTNGAVRPREVVDLPLPAPLVSGEQSPTRLLEVMQYILTMSNGGSDLIEVEICCLVCGMHLPLFNDLLRKMPKLHAAVSRGDSAFPMSVPVIPPPHDEAEARLQELRSMRHKT